MHLAIITAGGAGMFCGSCMHDNTWTRALQRAGHEASLIPMYTPIRVDEEDRTSSRIFYGGINTYLNDRFGFWQKLPRLLTRWLDAPWLLNFATRGAVGNDAAELGSLTASMLLGESGPHRRAGEEMAEFVGQLRPDFVVFSNAILSGSLRNLKRTFSGMVFCVLQGDDVFLDGLTSPWRETVMKRLKERVSEFDGFIVHSQYYRDFMVDYLDLPADRFFVLPLAIDCSKHTGRPKVNLGTPATIGYFARICPEKGLDTLVESVLHLRDEFPDVRLKVGGYLGTQNQVFFEKIQVQARELGNAFHYVGSPDTHIEKVEFFQSVDVFCVPARFREPKGLYVLEAWANGLPVVLPKHAAFPELIQSTGGGLLAEANSPHSLAESLRQVLRNSELRRELAEAGFEGVRLRHDLDSLALETNRLFERWESVRQK